MAGDNPDSNETLSILLESYCNVLELVLISDTVPVLSILLESYCNRSREQWWPHRDALSILLESYCNWR
ncbi:hypothetical protein TAM4_2360 [Thermococcus sp. AM4]|nr:hypothetical protein TAM4_2360 [Thermococcus sp. AM4]